MTKIIADYIFLPEPVRSHVAALEDFISDVDGRTICTVAEHDAGEPAAYYDEGNVDAEAAVVAINGLIDNLRSLAAAALKRDRALDLICSLVQPIGRSDSNLAVAQSIARDALGRPDA